MRWFVEGYPEWQFSYGPHWYHIQNCCGVREIADLDTERSPSKALYSLCLHGYKENGAKLFAYTYSLDTMRMKNYFHTAHPREFRIGKRSGIFFFTAVTSQFGLDDDYISPTPTSNYQWHPNPHRYGHNFKRYIERMKLGTVTASAEAINKDFHDNHKVTLFSWAVDWARLEEWFYKMRDKEIKWNAKRAAEKAAKQPPVDSQLRRIVAGGVGGVKEAYGSDFNGGNAVQPAGQAVFNPGPANGVQGQAPWVPQAGIPAANIGFNRATFDFWNDASS